MNESRSRRQTRDDSRNSNQSNDDSTTVEVVGLWKMGSAPGSSIEEREDVRRIGG
jgi:hypothetical protein